MASHRNYQVEHTLQNNKSIKLLYNCHILCNQMNNKLKIVVTTLYHSSWSALSLPNTPLQFEFNTLRAT